MSVVPSVELADLVRLSEGDADPREVLQRIVNYAPRLVPGCTGAGLTVRLPDGERTAAVSDESVARCHAVQFEQTGEGPAREVLRYGEPRRADDFAREDRWGNFPRLALTFGFVSCLALPLRSDRLRATALNLYADQPGVFAGTTYDVALLFAAQGGAVVDNVALYQQSSAVVEHLHRTLITRSLIERAKGVLMGARGLTSEEAFALLQRQSQQSNQKLRDVAEAVLRRHDPRMGEHGDVPWTPPRGSDDGWAELGG